MLDRQTPHRESPADDRLRTTSPGIAAGIGLAAAGAADYSPAPFPNTELRPCPAAPERLSVVTRLLLGVGGSIALALLATAAWLRPAEQGFGTHQQLGLPPCTSVALFGRRCPSCGMTTSWALLLDGHPWRACRANAGGALLAVMAIGGVPWMLASAASGRWLPGRPRDSLVVAAALLAVTVTLADWGWRLALDQGTVEQPAAAENAGTPP